MAIDGIYTKDIDAKLFFRSTYEEANNLFLKNCQENELDVRQLPLKADGHNNFIPVTSLGNKDSPNKLIVTSGIHGIEGFCGSATQICLISSLKTIHLDNLHLIIIHVINPVGMKNHRRVNGNNVDLNRNFFEDFPVSEISQESMTIDHWVNSLVVFEKFKYVWILTFFLSYENLAVSVD